ncbi:IclR family transcriptional regulator [Sinomonas cellulolyticus]|uniref:IclR family transcriptional regulator n=1 Tax=Sinomonas cellulolyticus TaxID=2801916 RepID=A0ABS1JZX2_9MICC|nr:MULTISPECIES: IclR family transcriptional regulator [Sinomonas]MBL0704970.1 IclR family transcriptional regulator [Sinomonas cellulolyticus]GHG53513.1 IclR family transcriptional regulator [Sinomonas sp. KCTC 49339]
MREPDQLGTVSSGEQPEARGTSPITNAIAVLRCFTVEEPLLGVTDIAARIGLHKSSVSRMLATLEAEDLVERDELTRRYRLGLGVIGIAGPLLAELDVRRVAHPVLRELTDLTGETSALLVWSGHEAVSVEQVPSPHLVKHTTALGTRYRTALSASVQVFLGTLPPATVRGLVEDGIVAYAPQDDAGLEALAGRLTEAAGRGYAWNFGETSLEEVGVSAPVLDHRGEVVAAVLVSAPRFRVSPEQLEALGTACARAAEDITRRLGGDVTLGSEGSLSADPLAM